MGGQYFLLSMLILSVVVDVFLLIEEGKKKMYKVQLDGTDLYVYRILEPHQSIHSLVYDCILSLQECTSKHLSNDHVTLFRKAFGQWVKVGTFQICNF